MIEASYTLEIDVGVDEVWEFVEVIPNWAHFLVGFRKLDLVDERRSVWTLRGDVGILARDVDLQVDITVWEPGERAEFTMTGLTERISGQGSFELSPAAGGVGSAGAGSVGAGPGAEADASAQRPASPPEGSGPDGDRPSTTGVRGLLRRLRFAVAGRLLRWLSRRAARAPQAGGPAQVARPEQAAGAAGSGVRRVAPPDERSQLRFHLQLTPGGPMAPMLELLMTPMIEPAAEDFLRNIRQALEARRSIT